MLYYVEYLGCCKESEWCEGTTKVTWSSLWYSFGHRCCGEQRAEEEIDQTFGGKWPFSSAFSFFVFRWNLIPFILLVHFLFISPLDYILTVTWFPETCGFKINQLAFFFLLYFSSILYRPSLLYLISGPLSFVYTFFSSILFIFTILPTSGRCQASFSNDNSTVNRSRPYIGRKSEPLVTTAS